MALFGRNWDARLVLVDFDRVEQKNVASQLHTRMGVGRNKAKALEQLMQGLFGVRVEAIPHRLVEDNARAILDGATVVVDCVDHGPTRRLVAHVASDLGVPCLHGALAADGGYARVMWAPRFDVDDGEAGAATCEDGEHLPFVALVAARMAHVVQRFLTDGTTESIHVRPDGLTRV